jgi:hypothetical protein
VNLYLHPACALIAWLALIYKATALRRGLRDHALVALCSVLTFSALSFTLSFPPLWVHVDQIMGMSNGAALVAHCCVIIVVVSQQIVLAFWASATPREAWRRVHIRLAVAALVLAVLIPLFLLMSPQEQRPQDFTLRYADHPLYTAYLLIYICFYALGEIEIAWRSFRYARVSPRLWLRRGLHLISLGATVTLGYSVIRIADLIAAPFSLDLRSWEPVAWICGDIGALLTLIGWTLPGWGPLLSIPRRLVRAHVQYRHLLPLWKAVHAAVPEIELAAPERRVAARFNVRLLEFALYRCVVEIRDGQLALRQYADPEVVSRAEELGKRAGIAGDRLAAVVEAAQLRSMLRAKERNLPPAAAPSAAFGVSGPTGFAHEAAWLVQVSRAFTRSPVVTAIDEGTGAVR